MTESFRHLWTQFASMLPELSLAIVVLAVSIFAGNRLGKLVTKYMPVRRGSQIPLVFFGRLISWLLTFVGIILALQIVHLERIAYSLLAGGGVTAIVLGFAFREIGENMLAGLFLSFSRPFEVGDTIRSEDLEGTVKGVELRNTHIRTADGRDIYIPSAQIFNRPLVNFTRDGLRRLSFTVGIDYADDAKTACALLTEILENTDDILTTPNPRVSISALLPGYIELEAQYWIDVFRREVDYATLRTDLLDRFRRTLLEEGYTVSASTVSNVAVTQSESPGNRMDRVSEDQS